MSDPFSALACSVEIYPFEGGPHILQGGQIKSVTVSKSLLGGAVGQFNIELAPGGPRGPEDPVTWSQIITPMSHVLIGMSRGSDAAIVMDGVATTPIEAQEWHTTPDGASAFRSQTILGGDFAWFFRAFNYYALTFQGLTAGTPGIAKALDYLPGPLAPLLSQGLAGGAPPLQVGRLWYQKVMAGQNGILAKTFVPFSGNSRYVFNSVVRAVWEEYPSVQIPNADYFMVGEDSWMNKFLGIFPHPWYEFFVTTAPSDAYLIPGGSKGIIDPGHLFTMQSMPYAPPAGPVLVARVNPTPAFDVAMSAQPTAGNVDTSRWNALPLFDFTTSGYGFLTSQESFSADDACNFYQLNPTYYKTLTMTNNANVVPIPFFFIAAADPASVQRYGFRPRIGSFRWMCDPDGNAAQAASSKADQTILSLSGRYISWFHPVPLMLRAHVTIPLSPKVLVGTRFRYAPFKNGEPWDFYIEEFQHRFVFGGSSSTTLTLSRGLPAAVYEAASGPSISQAQQAEQPEKSMAPSSAATSSSGSGSALVLPEIQTTAKTPPSSSGGLLTAIHTGNAMRLDGKYVVGLPDGTGPALQFIVTPPQAAALSDTMTNMHVTPQALGTQ